MMRSIPVRAKRAVESYQIAMAAGVTMAAGTDIFFGLGSYTIDAINAQDFSIVRAMVFLGASLYIVGLILADISYTLADPRVRFE